MMHFLRQMREAAREEPDQERATEMRALANELQIAIRDMNFRLNADTLALVNGLWARCKLLLVQSQPPEPHGGAAISYLEIPAA